MLTARMLLEVVHEVAPMTPAYCEQTGGGCATIYIGAPAWARCYADSMDEGDRFLLSAGPGSFDWSDPNESEFSWEEFCLGPDDFGDHDHASPKSLEEFRTDLVRMLAEPDWRQA